MKLNEIVKLNKDDDIVVMISKNNISDILDIEIAKAKINYIATKNNTVDVSIIVYESIIRKEEVNPETGQTESYYKHKGYESGQPFIKTFYESDMDTDIEVLEHWSENNFITIKRRLEQKLQDMHNNHILTLNKMKYEDFK